MLFKGCTLGTVRTQEQNPPAENTQVEIAVGFIQPHFRKGIETALALVSE